MTQQTQLTERLELARTAQQAGAVAPVASASVLGWLQADTTMSELSKALPRGMDAGRFKRIVQTEVRKNAALLESEPRSFILAVLNAAQLGLEPGPLGFSYLTGPFKNNKTGLKETVLILGYKGLKELAYRAGTVDYIDAVAVHEGEPFKIVRGSDQHIEHEERAECSDNPRIAFYAIAFPKDGGRPVFEVMWPKDIAAVKARSRAAARSDSPWTTDEEAMELKTVTRRMLNRGKVRLTADIQTAIVEDEARELGFDKQVQMQELPGIPAEAEPIADQAAPETEGDPQS